MLVVSESSSPAGSIASVIRLFRHSKCEQWGLAAVVWEHEGKRGYRFDDGSERVFAEGYYHLFESAPAIGEAAEKLLAIIHRERAEAARGGSSKDALPVQAPALEELIAVLHEDYPQGFSDPKWLAKHRGQGVKRRAKRHRDALLADAASKLSRDAMGRMIEAGEHEALLQLVGDVLAASDLVTKKQLEVLRRARPSRALAEALRVMMHEPDPDGIHFDDVLKLLVRSPGGNPSWSLMSALRVVSDPHNDMCMRPSVFFNAVRVVSPSQARKVSPQGGQYNRLVAIARQFRDQLRDAGEEPRDMLDVYDFIWTTCRPAADKVLARVRQRAAEEAAAKQVATAKQPSTAATLPSAASSEVEADDEPTAEAA